MKFDRSLAMIMRYKVLHVLVNFTLLLLISSISNRLGNFASLMLELKKARQNSTVVLYFTSGPFLIVSFECGQMPRWDPS